jgi:predicted NBD/HSP70 family sugar kinase
LCYGIGSTVDIFVCIMWGYGIGAASIVDGKPYYGCRGMAGEFGHITVDYRSRIPCMCGNYGCLETIASGWAIERAAREGLPHHPNSLLRDLCQGKPAALSARLVAQAARQGDDFSRSILNTAAEFMGLGLATLINLQNPDAIILGGGIMNMQDLIFDRVVDVARRRSLRAIGEQTLIRPASLGKESKTMGAVSLILNEVLNLNISTAARD